MSALPPRIAAAAALLSILGLSPALAQTPSTGSASPPREQVRKEAAEAVKAHRSEHGEAGQDSPAPQDAAKSRKSTRDRVEVRKEAAQANKQHRIDHGEAGQDAPTAAELAKSRQVTRARKEVKKETADANKAGELGDPDTQRPRKP